MDFYDITWGWSRLCSHLPSWSHLGLGMDMVMDWGGKAQRDVVGVGRSTNYFG